jgi:uncharacterized damage-inducible protein DinB
MNAYDTLEKGHLLVIQTVNDLPEAQWDVPGACGNWSVKDIVGHLVSYEHLVVDVLNTFTGAASTPRLDSFIHNRDEFNATEVKAMRYHTAQQVITEYQDLQVQSTSLLGQLPAETIQRPGTLPWLGAERSLADLVNLVYEHTREHCAQIARFREEVVKE